MLSLLNSYERRMSLGGLRPLSAFLVSVFAIYVWNVISAVLFVGISFHIWNAPDFIGDFKVYGRGAFIAASWLLVFVPLCAKLPRILIVPMIVTLCVAIPDLVFPCLLWVGGLFFPNPIYISINGMMIAVAAVPPTIFGCALLFFADKYAHAALFDSSLGGFRPYFCLLIAVIATVGIAIAGFLFINRASDANEFSMTGVMIKMVLIDAIPSAVLAGIPALLFSHANPRPYGAIVYLLVATGLGILYTGWGFDPNAQIFSFKTAVMMGAVLIYGALLLSTRRPSLDAPEHQTMPWMSALPAPSGSNARS